MSKKESVEKQDKRESFVRIVELRVNNTLNNIRLIGNLSDKSRYQYDAADVSSIISTLKDAIAIMGEKFADKQSALKFSLPAVSPLVSGSDLVVDHLNIEPLPIETTTPVTDEDIPL